MRVGSDIDAICGKCGEMRHVLVAKVDGRIAKVECHQCGGRHRYRPVGGATAAVATRRSAAGSGMRRKRAGSAEPLVEADPSRPRVPFDATETYRAGDRVVHPSFGEGVVQAVIGAS